MRITDITNITGITRRFKGGGIAPPPFKSDTDFDFFARDVGSLTLQEKVAGNDVEVVGGAVGVFDGASNVIINDVTELNNVTKFMLDFDILFDDVSSVNGIIFLRGGTDSEWIQVYKSSSTIRVDIKGTTSQYLFTTAFSALSDNTWYNIKINFDSSLASDFTRVSIDGLSYLPTFKPATEPTTTGSFNGTSYIGFTSIPIAGKLSRFNIENGSLVRSLYFNNNVYDSVTGIEATNNGVTFAPVTDYTPQSTQDALDLGYWKNKDWLRCTASGAAYQESTQAYGVWKWEVFNNARSTPLDVSFINTDFNDILSSSYVLRIVNNQIQFLSNGSSTNGFATVTDYLDSPETYGFKVERNSVVDEYHTGGIGSFAIYIKGGSFGDNYVLITTSSGSNPKENNIYTTSNYFTPSLITLDKIRNIKLTSGELKVEDFTEGTGTYTIDSGEQVINKALNTTGLPDTTGWTAHEGKKMHNFIDSYVDLNPTNSVDPIYEIFNKANETIFNQSVRDSEFYDSSNPFLWFAGNEAENELTYDKMNSFLNPAYQDRNFAALLTNYGTQLSMFRFFSYANQKTGDDLIDALKYINYITPYQLSDGSDYQTTDGKYYVKY